MKTPTVESSVIAADEQILDLNPWWGNPGSIDRDPKLRVLGRRMLQWDPPVLDAVEIGPGRLHTLRGPRQVGKSTTVKRLIQRLLEQGERRVLYFSFDLAKESGEIPAVVRRARALHPDPEGVWYLFLDEVTTIPDWQLGIKFMIDNGPADEDFILCTGSSARQVGSEQLPGRKGAGKHYLQLPVSFRDFCRDVLRISLPDEALSPGKLLEKEGLRLIRSLNLERVELERAWRVYREVGGFPAAIEDYLSHGTVQDGTVDMVWDILAGDVRSLGRDAVATLKLMERVNRSLGSPLSWHALAEEMDVAQTTAKDYVRMLAESFMLQVVYFWDISGRGLSPQKQRKVFFVDPLIGRVPQRMIPGSSAANADAVRENLVGAGLFRSSSERLVQAEPVPGSLCFWKSGRGTEVDFVTAEEVPGVRGGRFPVEVKGDSTKAISNARKSIGAAFGRGIIVTESLLDLEHPIPAVPAPLFLAALWERTERRPVTL